MQQLVDGVENLTVKELVWFNKLLQERLGISDAELMGVPVAAAPAPAAAATEQPAEEAKEEQTAFNVILEGFDSAAKIKIIKELRGLIPGLGLKEGKEMVRSCSVCPTACMVACMRCPIVRLWPRPAYCVDDFIPG